MNARLLIGAWLVGCSLQAATLLAQPASLLSFKSLAFTRAQKAMEFAADGTIYTVGNDVLRWDAGGTLVRLEKPHVQWALHNEDLTEAVWKKTNCTIVDSPFPSPRSGETGRSAQSIVATAAGDSWVEQKLAVGKLNVGNGSVFIRSDGPPQQVTIEEPLP